MWMNSSLRSSSKDVDLSRGILDAIDMDSYRVEKQSVMKIVLPDTEIEPVPTTGGGGKPSLSSTTCRTSSRSLMTSSAVFPGRMLIGCTS